MSGNQSFCSPAAAFQRPTNLEFKDGTFPFTPVSNSNFTAEELTHYFGESMSFDPRPRGNSSAGQSSSVTTSPSLSLTPGENAYGFDWSSTSESNSPRSSMFYGANHNDYECPQYGQNMLPEAPPTDIFTPSLVRRPPASQTRSQKVKYNFCVFCKNNGEDESYYLSHTLKDDNGRVTCPILYKYKCPICHATGPISHTIRYCPHNKRLLKPSHFQGQASKYEEMAHITVLKQMRSSTGSRRMIPPGVIGGPLLQSVPPSRRPQPDHSQSTIPLSRRPQNSQSVRPVITSNTRGPNAAHTGFTNQPCMAPTLGPAPMYGEILNQEDRQRRDRERVSVSSNPGEELFNFACNYQN